MVGELELLEQEKAKRLSPHPIHAASVAAAKLLEKIFTFFLLIKIHSIIVSDNRGFVKTFFS